MKRTSVALLVGICGLAAPSNAQPAGDEEVERSEEETGIDWVAFPTFKGSSDAGFVYGGRLEVVDYGTGESDPFDWELRMELNHSTKNRHEHVLSIDAPAWIERARLFAKLEVWHIDDANYFGIGNETEPAETPGANQFTLTEPRIQLQLRRDLEPLFATGGALIGLPTTQAPPESLLADERPTGWQGGRHVSGVAAVGVDTRDDEVVPRDGVYAELYSRWSVTPLSDYVWYGGGITESTYWAPVEWLVFAQRVMFEALGGDVPVTEMMRIGGTRNFRGIGGVYSQRGFVENRFIGPVRGIANVELRGYFPPLFGGLRFGAGPFAAVSRVFDGSGTFLRTWHPSAGGEVTISWKKSFLFRIDYAVSPDGGEFYIEGRHLF